jgi:UDP-N-acetylmuramate dehydrogenase
MTVDELNGLAERLEQAGVAVRRDHPVGPMTTYRVGGRAALAVEVDDTDHLARVAAATSAGSTPVLVVGNGSNLLVADAGFAGLVLHLGPGFEQIDIPDLSRAGSDGGGSDGVVVTVGGSAPLPIVARRTASAGLTGFEWAVGVPGTVGGAVRMNAGGHGSDMAAVLVGVRVVDLATGENDAMAVSQLGLGYRRSSLGATQVVTGATLRLTVGDRVTADAEVADVVRWRRQNQPGGANAGSVFTNPHGDSAGRLIDAAGCKGLRVGSAEVSTKHANFIQADVGGSADDIVELMTTVRRRVLEASGVELHAETRLVGFGARADLDGFDGTDGNR